MNLNLICCYVYQTIFHQEKQNTCGLLTVNWQRSIPLTASGLSDLWSNHKKAMISVPVFTFRNYLLNATAFLSICHGRQFAVINIPGVFRHSIGLDILDSSLNVECLALQIGSLTEASSKCTYQFLEENGRSNRTVCQDPTDS